jgi:hypothetical protein
MFTHPTNLEISHSSLHKLKFSFKVFQRARDPAVYAYLMVAQYCLVSRDCIGFQKERSFDSFAVEIVDKITQMHQVPSQPEPRINYDSSEEIDWVVERPNRQARHHALSTDQIAAIYVDSQKQHGYSQLDDKRNMCMARDSSLIVAGFSYGLTID